MGEDDGLSPDDPDLVPKLIAKLREHDKALKALQGRPKARQDAEALQWAKRPEVARRFLKEVRTRAEFEASGYDGGINAVPLLVDAKTQARSWKGLLDLMEEAAAKPLPPNPLSSRGMEIQIPVSTGTSDEKRQGSTRAVPVEPTNQPTKKPVSQEEGDSETPPDEKQGGRGV